MTTQQLDLESTKVLSALQDEDASLPRQQELNKINEVLITLPITPGTDPSSMGAVNILTADPASLSLGQKATAINVLIDANQPQVQQVVIGGPQQPLNVDDPATLQPLADALNQLDLKNTATISTQSLTKLTQEVKSIGKIVWAYSSSTANGSPMWQLAGTGFVTAPGIVTTACHVVSEIADVTSGQPKLKPNIVVKMDFSSNGLMQSPLNVSKIIAISSTTGCDVAQLAITGGADIPPLKVAHASSTTKRIIVVGYPLLDNYKVLGSCPTIGSSTDNEFCTFAQTYPFTAKVASPGAVLTTCCGVDHGGVSVLTYNAPTDGGQSGSPVFDADTLEVVGIHYCCTGITATLGTLMNCETWHPQNPSWNEAITTQSMLSDNSLRSNFSDIADSNANPVVASLSGWSRHETDMHLSPPE